MSEPLRKLVMVFGRVIILLLTVVWLVGCDTKSKKLVQQASKTHDPEKMKLEDGYNTYVQRRMLPDHTEVGVIRFANGDKTKYWFISHHLSRDKGCSLFEFSDGTKVYMSGYFCCDVQLPDKQMGSKMELLKFINEHGESN